MLRIRSSARRRTYRGSPSYGSPSGVTTSQIIRATAASSPHTTRRSLHWLLAMDERATRIGLNEAVFREVNERVRAINDGFGARLDTAEFVCECGETSCTERIRLSLSEYEALRAEPTHFAIKDGHEIPDVEDVVGRFDGYIVVAKKAGDPAELARSVDPRA